MKQSIKEIEISSKWYKGDIYIGSLSGLLTMNGEALINYLKENINDTGVIYKCVNSIVRETLIIKSLNVLEEYQGKGYGKKILIDTMNKYKPESIILIADIGKRQRAGFDLVTFYKKNEFKEISECMFYPLMFWPIEKADKILMEINK